MSLQKNQSCECAKSFWQYLTLLLFILSTLHQESYCKDVNRRAIPKPPQISNISSSDVLTHLHNFLQFTELNSPFENTRIRARDYIVDYLTLHPGIGFTADQVIYHKFDWTDTTVETKGNQEEVVTTTWSGVNILAWTNTSSLDENQKFSVVGARYDSQGWWTEHHGNTYSCSTTSRNPSKACSRNMSQSPQSQRVKTLNAAIDLLGSCTLMQFAREVIRFQHNLKEALESKNPLELLYYWDKKDPTTIETGIYEEIPILFIFFDQEAVGKLGSQVWSEFYDIGKLFKTNKIVSMTALDFSGTWKPFDPINEKTKSGNSTWSIVNPSVNLDTNWLTTLLTPQSDLRFLKELKKFKEKDEL